MAFELGVFHEFQRRPGQSEAETDVRRQAGRERLQQRRGVRDDRDEHHPSERKPGHSGDPEYEMAASMKK